MSLTTKVLGKSTETSGGKTVHVLKFRVCNQGASPVDIKLADNPWKVPAENGHGNLGPKVYDVLKPNGKTDDDKTREKALEQWKNPDSNDTAPVTLGKEGSATECREFTVRYDFEPACTYIDVFEKQPDGTYRWNGPNVTELWKDIKTVAHFPNGAKPQYVAVLPFWFPMSLESECKTDIELVLDRLDGLPDAFNVVHAFPGFGIPYPLTFGDRDSQCAIVLRQVAPCTRRHYVEAIYRVHRPAEFRHCVRHVGFWIDGARPARRPKARKQA